MISKATHVRVYVEAGNASHFAYVEKGSTLGNLEYPVDWIEPGPALRPFYAYQAQEMTDEQIEQAQASK